MSSDGESVAPRISESDAPASERDFSFIVFGLTVVVLLVGGVLGVVNTNRLANNDGQVSHSHKVIGELEGLLSTLTDAETGQRGYLLTEDDKYLQPYEEALRQVQNRLERIENLTSDNPSQQNRLAALEPKVAARLKELRQTVALAKGGDRPAALIIVKSGVGKAIHDDLRSDVAAMREVEDDLLRRRSQEAHASFITTVGSIVSTVIVGLVLVGVAFFTRQRSVRAVAAVMVERRLNAETLRLKTKLERQFAELTLTAEALRASEERFRRLNAELETRVRERTADLEASNRDLAQKNAENEMFVYSVSHDLRSPLVNLQGFSKELEKACKKLTEVLAEEAVPPETRQRGQDVMDGKVAKSIGFIQAAVMRLSNIIDALLRLSRAGRVDYRWEAVDVEQLSAQVVRAAHLTIEQRGATVTVGNLPPAWGDRTALEQLFANLVGNALNYLEPSRPGAIEVGCLPADAPGSTPGMRTYYVRDNGLGIAEAHRQRIFQPFQRAHPAVGNGEGLGLAIVARVVERHRGRVWVESRAGEGSTFYANLPVPPNT